MTWNGKMFFLFAWGLRHRRGFTAGFIRERDSPRRTGG